MVTIKPDGKNGRVRVIDSKNKTIGFGDMKPSNTHPGYCTIFLSIEPYVIRVPINWIAELEALDGANNA